MTALDAVKVQNEIIEDEGIDEEDKCAELPSAPNEQRFFLPSLVLFPARPAP